MDVLAIQLMIEDGVGALALIAGAWLSFCLVRAVIHEFNNA